MDRYWSAGTAGYADATRWGGTIPGSGDNAFVNNAGVVQIGASDPAWTVGDLRAAEALSSTGAYTQAGGTVTANGWMRLGFGAGATGQYSISAGVLNMNNRMYFGAKDGSQSGGGTGNLTITGGTVNQANEYVTVGARDEFGHANAKGFVNQSGGVFSVLGQLFVGNGPLGSGTLAGTYNLSGSGQLKPGNWCVIGRGGSTGVINMTGGLVTKSGSTTSLILGINSTGLGTINQSAGTFTNTVSPTWFGENGGSGVWNLSGTAVANLGNVYLTQHANAKGDFNLNGGTLGLIHFDPVMSDPATAYHSTIGFNGGTLKAIANDPNFLPISVTKAEVRTGGAVIDSNGFNITLDRGLSTDGSSGGLTKKGAGTMILAGSSSFTGSTAVTLGSLILNGSINATAPAATTYHDTIGIFSCASLTLSGTAKMKVDIDSSVSLADRVIVAGNVNLGGSLLQVTDLANVALPPGTKLKLIEYTGSLTGAFSNAADNSQLTVGPNAFTVKYNDASALTLTVPGMTYPVWSAAMIANSADRDTSADPDNDGRPNILEYALDGNPVSGMDDGKMRMATVPGTPPGMSLTLPVRAGATFTGTGPLVSNTIDGVSYIIEASTDLLDFTSVGLQEISPVTGSMPGLSDGWEYRSFQLTAPTAKSFIRARVQTP